MNVFLPEYTKIKRKYKNKEKKQKIKRKYKNKEKTKQRENKKPFRRRGRAWRAW